jgi:hypothetical protein
VTVILSLVAIATAVFAAWIGRDALLLARDERARSDARFQLESIERLVELLHKLQSAQGAPHEDLFHDTQMSMRAMLSVSGLRRWLPVTAILSGRGFNPDAANGRPDWPLFVSAIDAARDELFAVADGLHDPIYRAPAHVSHSS